MAVTIGAARLAALMVAVDRATAALDIHAASLAAAHPGTDATPSPQDLAYLGVQVSAWYNALEDFFGRVQLAFGETVGSAQGWHMELLNQMLSPLPHFRPAILDGALRPQLADVLKFRHFLRHAYAVQLSWDKLQRPVDAVIGSHPLVVTSLARFRVHLEASLAS